MNNKLLLILTVFVLIICFTAIAKAHVIDKLPSDPSVSDDLKQFATLTETKAGFIEDYNSPYYTLNSSFLHIRRWQFVADNYAAWEMGRGVTLFDACKQRPSCISKFNNVRTNNFPNGITRYDELYPQATDEQLRIMVNYYHIVPESPYKDVITWANECYQNSSPRDEQDACFENIRDGYGLQYLMAHVSAAANTFTNVCALYLRPARRWNKFLENQLGIPHRDIDVNQRNILGYFDGTVKDACLSITGVDIG